MIDAFAIEGGRAALDAMNDVALLQQSSARYAPSCPATPVMSATF
jgi:hypothetical protein